MVSYELLHDRAFARHHLDHDAQRLLRLARGVSDGARARDAHTNIWPSHDAGLIAANRRARSCHGPLHVLPRSARRANSCKAAKSTWRRSTRRIEGIPRDRVRLHCCWGNWEGPHIHDVALEAILPVLYQANVGALSIEFANPRHQHEYRALRARHALPDHMVLLPGVVDSTTNIVEHPEVVARRIEEAVAAVGDRERVIASADCGFGTFTGCEWVAEDVVWAKLKSCREGADIASRRLW